MGQGHGLAFWTGKRRMPASYLVSKRLKEMLILLVLQCGPSDLQMASIPVLPMLFH